MKELKWFPVVGVEAEGRKKHFDELPLVPPFMACVQAQRSDTVIGANEAFIKGDDPPPGFGGNIDGRGEGSHNNTSDHPPRFTAPTGRKRPINY